MTEGQAAPQAVHTGRLRGQRPGPRRPLRAAVHSAGVFGVRALQSLGASYGMVPLPEAYPTRDDTADGPGHVVLDGAQSASGGVRR